MKLEKQKPRRRPEDVRPVPPPYPLVGGTPPTSSVYLYIYHNNCDYTYIAIETTTKFTHTRIIHFVELQPRRIYILLVVAKNETTMIHSKKKKRQGLDIFNLVL